MKYCPLNFSKTPRSKLDHNSGEDDGHIVKPRYFILFKESVFEPINFVNVMCHRFQKSIILIALNGELKLKGSTIPNNNDNQDIVSMGTNAAQITNKVIENAFEVVAIEMITITQAIKYLNVKDKVSSKTKKMYEEIRSLVPLSAEDVTMYPYINAVKKFILKN